LTAGLFAPTGPLSSSGPPLVFSILQIISLPVIPLGMLVGLFGLLVLLGVSAAVRWGVGLAAVATLLLIIEVFVPFFFMIGSHDASPGYGAIGAMIFLSHAVSVLSSLSSTAPFALSAVGLMGSVMLSGGLQFVVGLLWVALGVALWRHAPENQNVGTTPQIS
jgi:hypothetical protein